MIIIVIKKLKVQKVLALMIKIWLSKRQKLSLVYDHNNANQDSDLA